jgi:hypothetical protein
LKGARYSLWKNPENLSENQAIKLAWIAATDPRLYWAYLLTRRPHSGRVSGGPSPRQAGGP